MGPINRGPGPLLGMRMSLPGMRPPPPLLSRFGPRLPPPGMPPMRMPPPAGGMYPPMRQRMPPPPPHHHHHHPPLMQQRIPPPMQPRMPPPMQQRMPPPMQQRMPPPMQQRMPPPMQQRMPPPIRQRMPPPRPGMRPGGPMPMFGPRIGCGPPLPPPMMGPRGPRGPPLRPGPRGMLPHMFMRPRFLQGNNTLKNKGIIVKKVNKLEELELKKPWMTDAIRTEIQKKNKLYTKARKSKDAKEWENFKDLRNKVTRMIRDAKNEYLEKHPENKALIEKPDEHEIDVTQEMMDEEESFMLKTDDDDILIEESENNGTLQESMNKQDHINCQETMQLVAAQN